MAKTKVAVSLDSHLVAEVDSLVAQGAADNRSQAVEAALRRFLDQRKQGRLRRALAGTDPAQEKAEAEEWFTAEVPWPDS